MKKLFRSRAVAALVAALGLAALAGEGPADPVAEASALAAAGRYGDARSLLAKRLESRPGDVRAVAALADLLLIQGSFEEAEKVASRAAADPRCRTLRAESLFSRGRREEARKLVESVLGEDPDLERARYLLGRIHLEAGRRKAALAAFEWFFDHYARNDLSDPEALTLVAAASVRVAELTPGEEMDFHVTMKLLDEVTRKHPEYLPAYVVKGDLYLAV